MLAPAFARLPHPNPTPDDVRAAAIADPAFGHVFTDHMVSIRYSEARGWHDAQVMPRGPLALDPATAVLHYAQEIFEGMKAYRLDDGSMALFRPEANAARFNASARRMAMAEMPEELFIGAVKEAVAADAHWFPPVDGGALYLRPFMFASEVFLGVKPASEYQFLVITSPVGNYFKSGAPAISLWVSDDYTRAAPGGTGAAKCGGNYASSLVAQRQAIAKGCDQVVFLDAAERRWIEELGGMNIFFVFDDGSIVTPPLTDTILPGITRDAIITLARDAGLTVREERYAIDQWEADAKSGRLTETFSCGTAVVVTPVGQVTRGDTSFTIGAGGPGQVTEMLKARLVDIQRGRGADPHGWVTRL
ncbi:MAG: branched chain amino acid aminotransferase [Sphingopyxis macrogoltabida]|uniref:Branched-chain-amino-acid aminotransferase n=1 Tax=Sphingopyxis macrogoltabida TaxID=33050 RepID=A0A2W5MWA6_SPHMC|nr:MAG: branched chain amino acid aminotransferase [Sphingopyxis macrogoltabida]